VGNVESFRAGKVLSSIRSLGQQPFHRHVELT
jgi:hypothetical protein